MSRELDRLTVGMQGEIDDVMSEAYNLGVHDGKEEGRSEGYDEGHGEGYDQGYKEGHEKGMEEENDS